MGKLKDSRACGKTRKCFDDDTAGGESSQSLFSTHQRFKYGFGMGVGVPHLFVQAELREGGVRRFEKSSSNERRAATTKMRGRGTHDISCSEGVSVGVVLQYF